MAMSMPNLHSSRSTHNRGIGYSVLSSVAESGGKQGKRDLRARIEDFESLLEDLCDERNETSVALDSGGACD